MSVVRKLVLAFIAALGLVALVAGPAGAAPYTNTPTVQVSTTNPAVGGTITLSGSGFGPNDTLRIAIGADVLGTTTTDSSGAYSATVTLPASLTGRQTIVITDTATGQTASVVITIGATTAGNGGGGGVSNTGVAVMSIGGLGVLLLVGGAAMVMLGKRRRATV